NQTDSLVYSTERTLNEHGAKLGEADRKAVDEALAEAREALKSEDVERMKRAQEKLTRASHKLAEIMYREAQGPTQQPPGAPGRGWLRADAVRTCTPPCNSRSRTWCAGRACGSRSRGSRRAPRAARRASRATRGAPRVAGAACGARSTPCRSRSRPASTLARRSACLARGARDRSA